MGEPWGSQGGSGRTCGSQGESWESLGESWGACGAPVVRVQGLGTKGRQILHQILQDSSRFFTRFFKILQDSSRFFKAPSCSPRATLQRIAVSTSRQSQTRSLQTFAWPLRCLVIATTSTFGMLSKLRRLMPQPAQYIIHNIMYDMI